MRLMGNQPRRDAWLLAAAFGILLALSLPAAWSQFRGGRSRYLSPSPRQDAEFHFIRLEYVDFYRSRWGGRGWWMQDWPAAEIHFSQGIRRLTRIEVGDERHVPLTDDSIFDYPWVYATQVGFWQLSDEETARLREYLLRGGFLVVDDFHGPEEWSVFSATMSRVFPEYAIEDMGEDDPLLHVLYDLDQRTQIPGLRHLRIGPGGETIVQPEYIPPIWRGIYDNQGRLLVAVNFNMDVGDAWEHADMPEYPEPMTALAYRFGINYILYAMTH
jgi:hypothetical protein